MYGSGESLLSFFSSVARQLPQLVVIVAGLVVVLGRKSSHPRASNLAAAGLVVALLSGLAGALFYALAPRLVQSAGGLGGVFMVASAGFSALDACGLGLLVAAVVADRAPR
jgi:drug/metabolite transporter (DMT)-like permease